jgi:hypothetical protein
VFRTSLRVQEQLGSADALDRGRLAFVRALQDVHQVSNAERIGLHVTGHGAVRTGVALSSELFRPYLTDNAMVVNDSKVFATNAHNDTDFIGRPSTTQDNQIVQFVSGEFVLTRGHLGRFAELRNAHCIEIEREHVRMRDP